MSKLTTAQYAEQYIKRFGWHLVPIESGRKFPQSNDWGNNCLSTVEQAHEFYTNNPNHNIGLALSPSRMCSLDIDDEAGFQLILEEYGLPIDALDDYPTIRGRGRRVMFRVPDGVELPYCKLNWPKQDDHKKMFTVLELRASCDGKQRQDVLPPSIHPDTGKPYEWLVQPPKTGQWPTPPDWLLAIWQAWDDFKPQFADVCPWVEHRSAPQASQQRYTPPSEGVSVIDEFNKAHNIHESLERYGYTKKGKRYLSPSSGTGLAGVCVFDDNRCFIHHASDPLSSAENNQPVNPFDLYCYHDHNGDVSKAVKAAVDLLGLKREARPVPPIPTQSEPVGLPPEPSEAPQEPTHEFRCLGYNGSKLYVLPRRSEQVVALSAGSLSKPALLQIASLEWWEFAHPKQKGGCDWDAAMSTLIRNCESKGIYDSRMERGRGAWYDGGKPVLHLGSGLIVDGKHTAISGHHSDYIYTRQARMENLFDAKPATDEQAKEVIDIFSNLNWTRNEHGLLALGWCVLAPICGALKWRPHLWLTARRGAGKSWVQSYVMKPVVGEQTLIYCQGGTTEAGIRQSLKHDARPVMFDEAESEDAAAARRMQSVLELARQASSDTGAEIVKGTATGDGMTFNVRSMFMMGSINVALRQAADESRFSVVSLNRPPKDPNEAQRFADFERRVTSTLTDEFCASVRARMYHAIPVIRHNASAFAQAVAEALGSQRMGDQIGTLLAGAFAMNSVAKHTVEECRELIKGMDFSEAAEAESVSDENNCINEILQRQVRIELEVQGATTRSLGELVDIVTQNKTMQGIAPADANDVLARHGLRVENAHLWVANTHAELAKTLRDTPWSSGHRRLLLRIEGAHVGDKMAKFAGTTSRFVAIPLSSIS